MFIHNPHSGALQGGRAVASHSNDISILNINQQVSAVAAGQLNDSGCDTLLIGTPTNFLAYDVENNSDLFYKDVSQRKTAFYELKDQVAKYCMSWLWNCFTRPKLRFEVFFYFESMNQYHNIKTIL